MATTSETSTKSAATSPRVTLRSLAHSMGLPVSTVGNILRGDDRYADRLRERVQRLAEQAGYRPDPLARGLSGGKTQTIGVLWALSVPQVSSRFTRGIARQAHEAEYQMLITDIMSDPDVLLQGLEQYLSRRVDGVIAQMPPGIKPSAQLVAAIRAMPAIVLIVDQFIPELPVDQIERDAVGGYVDALTHLFRAGCQRPGLLVLGRANEGKIRGFHEAMGQLGHTVTDSSTISVQWDPKPFSPEPPGLAGLCAQAVARHLDGPLPWDALLCGSDEIALSVMGAAQTAGLRVPEDLAIVGFNNTDFTAYLKPGLASISRESEQLADLAMALLMRRIKDPARPAERKVLRQRFVWRESAGPLTQEQDG